MPEIRISVNDSSVQALLTRAPGVVDVAMRSAMNDATSYVKAIVKRYPQQRAGSKYKRTHVLEKSWSSRITGSGTNIVGEIGSSGAMAPYNRVVMDRAMQARVHQGRWDTVQDIQEREQPRVQHFFADRIQAALGR